MLIPSNIDYEQEFIFKLTVVTENGDREHMVQNHRLRYLQRSSIISSALHMIPDVFKWNEKYLYWVDDYGDLVRLGDEIDLKIFALFLNKNIQVPPRLPHFVLRPNCAKQVPAKVLFS
uniref:(northern house mosquito) hypothetical protein n=1 Tax=Culex pipiens TaxID=7175 RepID=A0A8D8GLQ6_CULPI